MNSKIILMGLFIIVSCTNKNSSQAVKKITKGSIIKGTIVNSTDSISSSVVGIYNSKEKSICSGSLIAHDIVLTAAHCLPKNPQEIKIIFALDIDDTINIREPDVLQEYVLPAIKFKVGAKWNPQDDKSEVDTGDIALIKFKGKTPAGYKPAVFLNDSKDIKIGQMVLLAGYGVDTVSLDEINPKKFRNIDQAIEDGDVICDGVDPKNYGTCYEVNRDGDGLLRITNAPISIIHETEVRLNEKKSGTCSGDSGGPAYIQKNGVNYLFGITSRGSDLCDDVGVYTNALYYKTWIDESIIQLSK